MSTSYTTIRTSSTSGNEYTYYTTNYSTIYNYGGSFSYNRKRNYKNNREARHLLESDRG